MNAKGLILAAPHSNSGKTFITLSLLRALKNAGHVVASAKVGPDYIDPAFHTMAGSHHCFNLDGWAMRDASLSFLLERLGQQSDLILCEGAMGLFDGANTLEEKDGSCADLAKRTGWPVLLVVDGARQARSVTAVIQGFQNFDPEVRVAGVIFNQVASQNHQSILARACENDLPDLPILGYVRRAKGLSLPERHLGLVQAEEHKEMDIFLEESARHIETSIDLTSLIALARVTQFKATPKAPLFINPLGQRIAIAKDKAFSFVYRALLDHWQASGSELDFFSPLKDEGPPETSDAIYLPGGYPELHAAKLATNEGFKKSMRAAHEKNVHIFGECGGYMTLGRRLTDKSGTSHEMLGLLALETSFENPVLHLGYRKARLLQECALGQKGQLFRGHEFHYSRILAENGASLFDLEKSDGAALAPAGIGQKNIAASFVHLIDRA